MMPRRHPPILWLAFWGGVGISGCAARQEPPQEAKPPKNLILISMDTVRADHLGCYGYQRATTPRLDVYARRGAVFEHCTSSSSWTVPAHLTMFTGMEPATHGCVFYDAKGETTGRLNEDFETMAKIFTRAGFYTGAFTGGGFAGRRPGLDVGFQIFATKGILFQDSLELAWGWLDIVQEKPFFLFLHGFNAHRPYAPPPPYNKRFAGSYQGGFDIFSLKPGMPRPSNDDLSFIISQYDGEIACMDDLLGDFLDELEKRGVLQDTLVVITSDHGDEFYEHGNCDHIRTLYDELTQVPWIMFGPSIPPVRIKSQVGTIDLLPTMLTIFGLKTDATLQGVSRASLLEHDDLAEETHIFSFTGKGRAPHHLSSVRTSKWKLVTDLPPGRKHPMCPKCKANEPEGRMVRLVDLANDPSERHNVADKYPAVTRALYGRLTEKIEQCRLLSREVKTPQPATEDYTKTLRSLGYVGDED